MVVVVSSDETFNTVVVVRREVDGVDVGLAVEVWLCVTVV